jgi:hypothetical protein
MRWVERTVLHNEIYFPPASSFNDPFDLRAVFSFDAPPEQQRADFLRSSRMFAPHLSNAEHEADADRVMREALNPENISVTTSVFQLMHNRLMTSAVGVYCVSERCDDVLMWAHYADSHKGVCLEFDGYSSLMAQAQQVDYVEMRPSINPYLSDDPVATMEKAFLTKAEQWKYEGEWRLIRTEGPGEIQFPPDNLTGIIIGASAPTSLVETVKTWCRQRGAPTALRRAVVDARKFQLNIVPVKL